LFQVICNSEVGRPSSSSVSALPYASNSSIGNISGASSNQDINFGIQHTGSSVMQHWGENTNFSNPTMSAPSGYYKPEEQSLTTSIHQYSGGGNLVRDVSFDSGMELESCVSIGSYTNFHFNARQSLNIDGFNGTQDNHLNVGSFPHNEHHNSTQQRPESLDLFSTFREDSYSENSDDFSNESTGENRAAVASAVIPSNVNQVPFSNNCHVRPHLLNGMSSLTNSQAAQSRYGELYFGNTPEQPLFMGTTDSTHYHGNVLSANSTQVVDSSLHHQADLVHYQHPQVLEFSRTMGVPDTNFNLRQSQHLPPPDHFSGADYFHKQPDYTNSFNSVANGCIYANSQTNKSNHDIEATPMVQSSTSMSFQHQTITEQSVNGSPYTSLHILDPNYAPQKCLDTSNQQTIKEAYRNGFQTLDEINHEDEIVSSSKDALQNDANRLEESNAGDNLGLGEIIKKSMVETVSA